MAKRNSNPTIENAIDYLKIEGYVVLTAKAYYAAQERQRIHKLGTEWALKDRDSQRKWMEDQLFPEERRLRERLTFVYGVARAKGATVEELTQ